MNGIKYNESAAGMAVPNGDGYFTGKLSSNSKSEDNTMPQGRAIAIVRAGVVLTVVANAASARAFLREVRI